MSRQNGESMKQYVSRRRRCWTHLVQMDPVIHLSEGHRSDMLLHLSGLTREERVMVQASIDNERDFDKVAEAFVIQHLRVHLRESQRRTKGNGKDGSKRGDTSNIRWFRGKGKGKHTGSGKLYTHSAVARTFFSAQVIARVAHRHHAYAWLKAHGLSVMKRFVALCMSCLSVALSLLMFQPPSLLFPDGHFSCSTSLQSFIRPKIAGHAHSHSSGEEFVYMTDSAHFTKLGSSTYYENFNYTDDYDCDDDVNEPADACQAHNDPFDPGSDDGEETLDDDDDEENVTFSSYVALDDVTVFEAAELDAIALFADMWDNNLDPEVSAQLVQASAQAYLCVGKEKGKGKGKGNSTGRCPVRPSHLSLEDRRRRLKELKAKTECRACGRKGHWAHDRECAMSPSNSSSQNQTRTARMTTQQHHSNQAKQVVGSL